MLELRRNVVKSFAYLSWLIELFKGRTLSGYDILVHVRRFRLDIGPRPTYHWIERM